MSKSRFYVYVLCRPDGTPFYVGKGQRRRLYDHEREARLGHHCHKCHTIRAIWREGGEVVKHIVFRTDNEHEAFAIERTLIAEYGRNILTNLTDGGEGPSGVIVSEEVRARRAAGVKARAATAEGKAVRSAASRRAAGTIERRAKVARLTKAAWADPEKRAQRIQAIQAARMQPEVREKTRSAIRAAFATPEGRQRKSDATTKNWEDPSYRQKVVASMKAAAASPDGKTKRSAASKRRMADPEVRAKLSAIMKVHYGTPEGRAKRSRAAKKGLTPEGLARLGEGSQRAWADDESRARRINNIRRTNGSEKARSSFREQMQTDWADPERRAERSRALQQSWDIAPAERRAKVSSTTKAAWTDPEKRAARIAAIKASKVKQKGKLDDKAVEIRALYATGNYSLSALGKLYGASAATVWAVVHKTGDSDDELGV